jgi:hypothetical protein
MARDDQPSHSWRPSLEERRLSKGLAGEKLDQGGHTIIRDYDGISRAASKAGTYPRGRDRPRRRVGACGEAFDANDLLYAFESSADYDPAPKLNAIIKPMLTINFADDFTNPPELLHLPTASNYTEVMFPAGPASYGHMTLAHTAVWASALGSFLQRLPHER